LHHRFFLLIMLAAIPLTLNCLFTFLMFSPYQIHDQKISAFPTLISTPAVAYPGQVVLLYLTHFLTSPHVLLWRDGEDHVRLGTDSSLVQVSLTGEATVPLLVEDTWGTGRHFIEAENIETHSVARTLIQVIGGSPTG
jgi:hypothetical protein